MAAEVALWRLPPGAAGALAPFSLQPPPTSLDEASSQLPAGAYTTFRTLGGNGVLRLSEHLARLDETARLAGVPVALDHGALRQALRQALHDFGAAEARGRITVDLTDSPGAVYIALGALRVPSAADYTEGVRAVTRTLHRDNPRAKVTTFLDRAAAVRAALPPGIHEALMVGDDGRLLEGLSSNFFAIREGVLWTAEEGVLPGITRTLVLEEAAALGIPCHRSGIPIAEIAALDEAFITSASRAVLPVVEIDGQPVGDGRPGPLSTALLARYVARLAAEVETV